MRGCLVLLAGWKGWQHPPPNVEHMRHSPSQVARRLSIIQQCIRQDLVDEFVMLGAKSQVRENISQSLDNVNGYVWTASDVPFAPFFESILTMTLSRETDLILDTVYVSRCLLW